MSFLGGLFSSNTPDERFVDDQAAQEDYRDNKYVGHVIDQACTVYDTMFSALEYTIKGRSNVIEQLDKVIAKLKKQCDKIVEKYKEILSKLTDANAGVDLSLSLDIAKDALAILNANPILRRYVGEANYWMLWDMLAVLAGQGVSAGADISSNIKNAIKGTIYALLSMTNGMMHFEAYIAQITQFWGWLYMKEIWLPLTDSVCPQVTCQYYYKKPLPDNPVPGPANYAPMPVPIFDQVKYSWPYILSHFSYDDPTTWDVLTPASRNAMKKAYAYWKSNYTNAISANDLLSGASSKLTGGAFTLGFGTRNTDYPGGAPLKIGKTFNQLDTDENVSFPVKLVEDAYAEKFAEVDKTFLALVAAMNSPETTALRDTRLSEAGYEDFTGDWDWALGRAWMNMEEERSAVIEICSSVAGSLPEFANYRTALVALSRFYFEKKATPYVTGTIEDYSPLSQYLLTTYKELAEDASLASLKDFIEESEKNQSVFNPYQLYSDNPDSFNLYCYIGQYLSYVTDGNPFYTGAAGNMSFTVDADGELGRKCDGGREPLFAALGIYGDLKGLYPWDYEIVPLDSFRASYTKIKGSYHIYYKNDDPSRVIFADRTIQAGALKYIATCKHATTDTISRGSETFTAYIFPSETCSVYEVPNPGVMFGVEWPSLSSLQRVDAVNPSTGQQYMYDLTRNQIPRYPKFVDADKWSVMDLIHELWLLADALAPICGDGGERKQKLNDLLNKFGLHVKNGTGNGPLFIGQLPTSAGQGDMAGQGTHVELEFDVMNAFAGKIKEALDTVYKVRDAVMAATQAW